MNWILFTVAVATVSIALILILYWFTESANPTIDPIDSEIGKLR